MKLSKLKSDLSKEEAGILVSVPAAGGLKLRLRRAGNRDYRIKLAELYLPHRAALRADRFTDDEHDVVHLRAFCETVLTGWEEAEDDEGRPVTYTAEVGFGVLSDPRYHDLREFAELASTQQQRFRAEETKEDLGNSFSSSNGHSLSADSRSSSEGTQPAASTSQPSTGDQGSNPT